MSRRSPKDLRERELNEQERKDVNAIGEILNFLLTVHFNPENPAGVIWIPMAQVKEKFEEDRVLNRDLGFVSEAVWQDVIKDFKESGWKSVERIADGDFLKVRFIPDDFI